MAELRECRWIGRVGLTRRANVVFEYRILEGRIEKILNLLIIFKIGGYEIIFE